MNIIDLNILDYLYGHPFENQRLLAEASGYAVGTVNKSLKKLQEAGFLDGEKELTSLAYDLAKKNRPKNAIILTAGFGMRMVPINMVTSKGLLEVKGERLVERTIGQLQEAGIEEIYVLVGFMKEKYEYLIDKYGVRLLVNKDYTSKNNLSSLALAGEYLGNSYVIPCDIRCEENPYRGRELYSWYMVSDQEDRESQVRINRKMELVRTAENGNAMVGIAYLAEKEAGLVKERLKSFCGKRRYDGAFWEETLYEKDRMILPARLVAGEKVMEINTYEQLREADGASDQLGSEAIETICRIFQVEQGEILHIETLKKGMTNRSFLFDCQGRKYVMRIPGEGTEALLDRGQEAAAYKAIRGLGICDAPVYLDPERGYKISRFIHGARACDPCSEEDLRICMKKLREFHREKLQVDHEFRIFDQIDFYESLWKERSSVYDDYKKTKEAVFSLRGYIEEQKAEKALTHIDANADNFLFYQDREGRRQVQLTDWEYAAMADQDLDIAMFAIYSLYDRRQVDHLIDLYWEGACDRERRLKIYCYIAAGGLLWSNWCEYKRGLGIEFGSYSLAQYRYAKEYYRIVRREMGI